MRWSTELVHSEDTYANGERRTSVDFLIIRTFYQSWAFPINQHHLYRRKGTLRSVACFDRYGNPLRDSIFDKKGRFLKVAPIKAP